ncbi:unnamed protein product [Meganyctiphanes norvegica]|uniref:Uncharacterized protein n=1 Tax=Meganyctiphanes norvegica TaxID=48144 RepID=A0AAV2SZB0_MEGNR
MNLNRSNVELACSTPIPMGSVNTQNVLCIIRNKVTAHNVKTGDILELDAKTGIDGSRSHRARHQKVDSAKSLEENPHLNPEIHKNYLLTCFCPLLLYSVKGGLKTEIWKKPSSQQHQGSD